MRSLQATYSSDLRVALLLGAILDKMSSLISSRVCYIGVVLCGTVTLNQASWRTAESTGNYYRDKWGSR